jgi:biotin operon repressor
MTTTIKSETKFALIPDWVIDLDISSTAFRLYAVLAKYADNQTHQAFPSRETLADRLKCSVKTVERAVQELEAAGAIRKESRGRYHSTLYTLVMSRPRGQKCPNEGTKMSDEATKMSERGDKNVALTIPNELDQEELDLINIDGFDEFWSIYPLKREKPKARRAFEKATKRVGAIDRIIEGAVAYRDDPNRQDAYTKYPATWLNNDCWDDGPLPSKRKESAVERAMKVTMMFQQQKEQREIEGEQA